MKHPCLILLVLAGLFLAGCATAPTRDVSAYRNRQPRSILVLPPVNQSTDIGASMSVYTTVTRPLSELGYYVFPIGIVDTFMKENGCPTPNEMHQVSPKKLNEVFGADAALYITIEKYGSKYLVITSTTVVAAKAKLIDTRTGGLLWQGSVNFVSGGNSGLIEALVDQVVNKLTDQAHGVALQATWMLLADQNRGIPSGPRHPKFEGPVPAPGTTPPPAPAEKTQDKAPPLRFAPAN